MTDRNFERELHHYVYRDMENGDDVETIDYRSLANILEELCDRIEKLEKGEKPKEVTDKQKLQLLLNEIKSTAKRKTCYESVDFYEYSDDYDATFDDGDRYGKIMFSRELLESIGESYD